MKAGEPEGKVSKHGGKSSTVPFSHIKNTENNNN